MFLRVPFWRKEANGWNCRQFSSYDSAIVCIINFKPIMLSDNFRNVETQDALTVKCTNTVDDTVQHVIILLLANNC